MLKYVSFIPFTFFLNSTYPKDPDTYILIVTL